MPWRNNHQRNIWIIIQYKSTCGFDPVIGNSHTTKCILSNIIQSISINRVVRQCGPDSHPHSGEAQNGSPLKKVAWSWRKCSGLVITDKGASGPSSAGNMPMQKLRIWLGRNPAGDGMAPITPVTRATPLESAAVKASPPVVYSYRSISLGRQYVVEQCLVRRSSIPSLWLRPDP
jgi:hypothetical protein